MLNHFILTENGINCDFIHLTASLPAQIEKKSIQNINE